MKLIEAAKKVVASGLRITPVVINEEGKLPPKQDKRILSPQSFEQTSDPILYSWFNEGMFDEPANGYGLLLGNETGLFCFDIDLKNLIPEERINFYTRLRSHIQTIDDKLYEKIKPTIISTKNGGFHYYFYLDFEYLGSNNPCLLQLKESTIVELRTSAYAVTWPSPGYNKLDTTPDDFWNHIPTLNQHDLFNLQTACLRFQYELEPPKVKKIKQSELKRMSPVDAFDHEMPIETLLFNVGYEKVYNKSSQFEIRVQHPNATQQTSGAVYLDRQPSVYVEYAANGLFHNHRNKALKAHQVYAILNEIDIKDYKAINRALYREGYGSLFNSEAEKLRIMNEILTEFCEAEGIYYNTFSNRLCKSDGLPIDDSVFAKSYEFLSAYNVKSSNEERMRFWNNYDNFKQHNPVAEYFEQCIEEYTGEDVFSEMLGHMQFEKKKHLAKYLKTYLMQIVAQGLHSAKSTTEGLQTELILALYSKRHGVGKTRFFLQFLSQNINYYVSGKFSHKDLEQELQFAGNLLIVDDEASTLSKREAERIKSLTSHRSLDPVLKYKNYSQIMARRGVLGITSNRKTLINDIFNRRVIALDVNRIDVDALMEMDINQIWGQLGSEYLEDPKQIYIKVEDITDLNELTDSFKTYNRLDEILSELFIPYENKKRHNIKDMPFEHKCLRRTDLIEIVDTLYPNNRFNKFDYDKAFEKLEFPQKLIKDDYGQRYVFLIKPSTKVKNTETFKLKENEIT